MDPLQAEAGSGDDPSAGAGADNGGSGGGSGGTGVTGGAAGSLGIDFSPPTLCSGVESTLSAHAHGGTPPYEFSVVPDPLGLSIVTQDADASLSGTFTEAGDFPVTVQVTDGQGDIAKRNATLHVHDTPVVATTSLPDACPDQLYAAEITGSGGDGHYTFTLDLPQGNGLTVTGSRISGRFVNATGKKGEIDVTASVESGGCQSAPVTLALPQNSPSSPVCPHIGIVGGDPTLPAPCAGNDYHASLAVGGGTPGYVWQQIAAPEGLTFDPDSQSVSGIPSTTAAGTLTVVVADASGRTIESDFPIAAPRTTCWLAYLAPNGGPTQLNLLDPLLGNRHAFPDSSSSATVLDFKFSPDGRLLAYRTGSDPSAGELALLELASFREQLLDFSGVAHYSWSDDSHTLAVGYTSDQGSFLAGVDVSGDGGSGASLAFPELAPVAAGVWSDPVWFSGSGLAFLTSLGVHDIALTMSGLSGTGFATPNLLDEEDVWNENTYVRAAPDGVFVLPEPGYYIDYFPGDLSSNVLHDAVLVSPTGSFAAGQTDDDLLLYRPATSSFFTDPEPPPDGNEVSGCDGLLGWAPSGTRLACVHTKSNDTTQGELNVFDIDATTAAINDPITVRGPYDFPPLGNTGLARLFSPDGQRLAFETDAALYESLIVQGGSTVDGNTTFAAPSGAADSVLAFSPDSRFLLEHRGTQLRLIDFGTTPPSTPSLTLTGENPPPAPSCSEDFQAPQGEYCGELRPNAAFTWSADSRLIAMVTGSGSLLVKDLRFVDQEWLTTTTATDDCGSACTAGKDFAFQP
jgi:hypothetical protein